MPRVGFEQIQPKFYVGDIVSPIEPFEADGIMFDPNRMFIVVEISGPIFAAKTFMFVSRNNLIIENLHQDRFKQSALKSNFGGG